MRTENAIQRPHRREGFTLVELLTVIIIIGLLASILLPTVTSAIRTGYVTKTLAQRKNLEDGAENYKKDHHGFYPGQEDPALFNAYTGSQILAAAMYDFDISDSDPDPDTIIGRYASYKDDYLKKIDGKTNCLSDMFPSGKEKAFCYYPYRYEGTTRATKFLWTDNQIHTTGTNEGAANLVNRVKDDRFSNANDVYNEKRFVVIAPGVDRNYFTPDDIQNFNPS